MSGQKGSQVARDFNTRYTITESGCWEWNDSTDSGGYGHLQVNKKYWKAHRYSYFLINGEFDWTLLVCHTCDNPPCVNPDHLFLGTHLDNNLDCVRKGRHRSTYPIRSNIGEINNRSKLKEYDVIEIRKRASSGEKLVSIAKDYSVTPETIGDVCRRKTWVHV